MTSLRETEEKILLPYPIRQPARSREFAFAVTVRVNVDAFQNYFCLALYHDWNSELCFKKGKVLIWKVGKSLSVQR